LCACAVSRVQAFCAWKTAQDGQLVRYRVITEAEHQLIRNTRDRMDAYLLGDSAAAGAAAGAVCTIPDKGAAAGKVASKAVNITVTVGGAGAAAAAARADNVDMAMVVSGQDAVKVRQISTCRRLAGWGGGWRRCQV
jgi:hypothetical protein